MPLTTHLPSKFPEQHDVHPVYARRWRQWRVNELSYIGGVEYLYPRGITFDWVRPVYVRGSDGIEREELPERIILYSFLEPFPREPLWSYEQRRLSAAFRNLTGPVVDALAAFVQSKPVLRNAGGLRHLEDMWNEASGDVDLRGSTMDEFMREGLRCALNFGLVHCVADWPAAPPGAVRTLRDEKELRLRPYARWVGPLQLPRWKHDHLGRLVMAEVLEADVREDPDDPWMIKERPPLSRIWTEDRWELRESGSAGRLLAEGEHAYGRVPIETLYCRRHTGEPMLGVTPVDDIVRLNQRIFNLDSEIGVLEKAQYAFLAVPGGEKLGRLELGTWDAFAVPEGAALPAYISPPADNIRVLRETVVDLGLQIRARAGLSRGVAEQSIAARSGDALLVEAIERTNVVVALSQEARDFEVRFARLIGATVGGEFAGSVRYPDSYDLETFGEKLDAATKLLALPIPEAAKQAVLDELWRARLRHLPEERVEAIEAEAAASARLALPLALPPGRPVEEPAPPAEEPAA